MNFYLDFDYTLFDTHAFRQELYKILEANGLDKTYLRFTPEMTTNSQKLLNIRELFRSLSRLKGIPESGLLEMLEALYGRCSNFVYDDTVKFLQYLKSQGHKVNLLTWGDREFQSEKLMASKLGAYFDDVIFAEKLKYELDIDYANGIFVDDSVRDLEGLYNSGAKEVFRIKRKDGKNSNKTLNIKGISEFESLNALQAFLENRLHKSREKKSDDMTH